MAGSMECPVHRAVVKCLRSNLTGIDPSAFMECNMDLLAERYQELICDLLKVCSKPNGTMIAKACIDAWPNSVRARGEGVAFGRQLASCISYCRNKKKSMRSGVRLNQAVCKIASQFGSVEHSKFTQAAKRRASNAAVPIADSCNSISPRKSRRALRRHGSQTTSEHSFENSAASLALPPIRQQSRDDIFAKFGLSIGSNSSSSTSLVVVPADIGAPPIVAEPPANDDDWHYFLDSCERRMKRVRAGCAEWATMSKGADGFALATFADVVKTTELPNVLLRESDISPTPTSSAVLKKPAAIVLRKPAASTEAASIERQYGIMFYKRENSFALRRKFGNKGQAFQFKVFSREAGQPLADKCAEKLAAGDTEEVVREWARTQARNTFPDHWD